MKGAFLHNTLVTRLARSLQRRGYETYLECPLETGQHQRAVDLRFGLPGQFHYIEVELDTDRIPQDLAKARFLFPAQVLIVTPTARGARSVRAKLERLLAAKRSRPANLQSLHFGAALKWIATGCPALSTPSVSSPTLTRQS